MGDYVVIGLHNPQQAARHSSNSCKPTHNLIPTEAKVHDVTYAARGHPGYSGMWEGLVFPSLPSIWAA